LAFYDVLTSLPNRRLLHERLQRALMGCVRGHVRGALLYMDLDNFKVVNDTLGHEKGDQLLLEVTKRLQNCIREVDTAARLGGDEFVVMLEDLNGDAREAGTQALGVGEKIMAALARPYIFDGKEYRSSASIGVALFEASDENADELLKRADLAMYQAKAAGRNTLRFFNPEMQAAVTARADLESDLRNGLALQQFLMYLQPQVDSRGRTTGAEALMRWEHPARGMVSPIDFIGVAEDTGLIVPMGEWILETACNQLVAWATHTTSELTLSVNVSVRQFRQPDFVEKLLDILERTCANPARLKLELTESMLVEDVHATIAKMSALREHGVGFSIDDFGTGYSSLSYLKRLPLDQLKIDQSFVRDMLTDDSGAAIARAVITLGDSMGMAVIAEGVETQEQRDFLERLGCHAYQGYFFSRPLSQMDFAKYLAASGNGVN
jgi:diguanylate cyclase (GGDEF)-like protein